MGDGSQGKVRGVLGVVYACAILRHYGSAWDVDGELADLMRSCELGEGEDMGGVVDGDMEELAGSLGNVLDLAGEL